MMDTESLLLPWKGYHTLNKDIMAALDQIGRNCFSLSINMFDGRRELLRHVGLVTYLSIKMSLWFTQRICSDYGLWKGCHIRYLFSAQGFSCPEQDSIVLLNRDRLMENRVLNSNLTVESNLVHIAQ